LNFYLLFVVLLFNFISLIYIFFEKEILKENKLDLKLKKTNEILSSKDIKITSFLFSLLSLFLIKIMI